MTTCARSSGGQAARNTFGAAVLVTPGHRRFCITRINTPAADKSRASWDKIKQPTPQVAMDGMLKKRAALPMAATYGSDGNLRMLCRTKPVHAHVMLHSLACVSA
eukprot:6203262-Pleurochrysis_carterae.AAC.1